jgi:hypothetical protein
LRFWKELYLDGDRQPRQVVGQDAGERASAIG